MVREVPELLKTCNEAKMTRNVRLNPYYPKPRYLLFSKSVYPDQLASEKPADQDPHCFQLCLLKSC